jgi:predicted nuclease of predicted toxin-antitoxin system
MIRLLTDEDFHGPIVQGLLAKKPSLELVRVQDVGLRTRTDDEILAWAAIAGRVVLSHDRNTITAAASARVHSGGPMAGLIIVDDHMPIGQAIDELLLVDACTEMSEWPNRVEFLPL